MTTHRRLYGGAILICLAVTTQARIRPIDLRLKQAQEMKPPTVAPSDLEPPSGPESAWLPVGRAAVKPLVDSRGALIARTYSDRQGDNVSTGRTVATNPPDAANPRPAGVHFAVYFSATPGATHRMGYACYDPSGSGSFPIPGGKVIVADDTPESTEFGRRPIVEAMPDGRALIVGLSSPGGSAVPPYVQVVQDLAPFAGEFGGLDDGSIVDSATSQTATFEPGYYQANSTRLCLDINGPGAGDTALYVWTAGYNPSRIRWFSQAKVFKKTGTSMPGIDPTWTLVFVDSTLGLGGGGVVCDPTSSRVAVFTTLSFASDTTGNSGRDIRWADSPTGDPGTWTRHLVPNLTPTSVDMAFWQAAGLFDTQGKLHLIFTAQYREGVYMNWFGACRGLHWSEYNPDDLSVFCDARWPTAGVCGFNGFYTWQNISQLTIGECDNRLYIAYSAANDPAFVPNGDDCVLSQTNMVLKGNGEIYVVVSKDLAGRIWDKPRDVSNSYTPDCDTGTCASDWYPSLSQYGMDDADFAGTENWTTSGATWDLSGGSYTGSKYIQLYYLQDKYPGMAGIAYPNSIITPWTLNDMRWVRMSCAPPDFAADLVLSPSSISWPEWSKPGVSADYTLALNSTGTADLVFSSIVDIEDSAKGPGAGLANWMTVSGTPASIPTGGMDSMTVTLNAGGVIASGPTVLYGRVRFSFTPPAQTKDLFIRFTVADTVAEAVWDTVSTACLDLVVGTNGNIGCSGGDGSSLWDSGGVNMDYFGSGDCDTGSNSRGNSRIYLYDGSPIIIRKATSTTYRGSWSVWSEGIEGSHSFRPMIGSGYAPHGSFSTADYDGFNSGTFVTVDSLVKIEKTWWGPKHADSCHFIVQRMRVFPADIAAAVSNLQIGEAIDFDVPSDSGISNNVSGFDRSRRLVWQGGYNSWDYTVDCADNAKRWAGIALLKWFQKDKQCFDSLYGGATIANDEYVYNGVVVDSISRVMHVKDYFTESRITDVSTLLTFKDGANGYTLPANDTLTIVTVLATVPTARNAGAGLDSLKKYIDMAKGFMKRVLGICACCPGKTGNVNANGIVDLSDLSALVSYLTGGGYVLACPEAANVNAAGIVDLSDLSALVSYLTGGGYVLPNCP